MFDLHTLNECKFCKLDEILWNYRPIRITFCHIHIHKLLVYHLPANLDWFFWPLNELFVVYHSYFGQHHRSIDRTKYFVFEIFNVLWSLVIVSSVRLCSVSADCSLSHANTCWLVRIALKFHARFSIRTWPSDQLSAHCSNFFLHCWWIT